MSKRGDFEFSSDIIEGIKRIERYIKKMDYQGFLKDTKTQDAVIRNLEIIGEAVKNISNGLKEKHQEIDWKSIAGMRDKIIHFYFGVNWEIVWDVIQKKLPELKKKLRPIIEELK